MYHLLMLPSTLGVAICLGVLMVQPEDIARDLRAFILEQTNFEDPTIVGETTNLFEAGLLDSLLMANLVWFCEEQFKCTFDTADLTEDSFKSIATISRLVSQKLGSTKKVAVDQQG